MYKKLKGLLMLFQKFEVTLVSSQNVNKSIRQIKITKVITLTINLTQRQSL